MSKNETRVIVVGILIVALLLWTRQGRAIAQTVFQGTPLQMFFAGSDYVPPVLDPFAPQIPDIAGVSVPPYNPDADKDKGCCGCNEPRAFTAAAPSAPVVVYRSPDPFSPPPALPPPAPVASSYQPPMIADWDAYLRMHTDVAAHYSTAIRQPHFTKGVGKQIADKNRDGKISQIEWAEYHYYQHGKGEGRFLPKKPAY